MAVTKAEREAGQQHILQTEEWTLEIGSAARGKYWPFVIVMDDLRAERERSALAYQALAGEPGPFAAPWSPGDSDNRPCHRLHLFQPPEPVLHRSGA